MNVTYTLHDIIFEWDDEKAIGNLNKHNLSFEEACEVFFDPFLQVLDEEDEYVDGEYREKVVGMDLKWQLIYVVYVMREDRIRIISARSATPYERKHYETE